MIDTATRERMRADLAERMEIAPSDIGDEDFLMDLGLDSLRAMDVASAWEDAGLPVTFGDLAETGTLAGLWQIMDAR